MYRKMVFKFSSFREVWLWEYNDLN